MLLFSLFLSTIFSSDAAVQIRLFVNQHIVGAISEIAQEELQAAHATIEHLHQDPSLFLVTLEHQDVAESIKWPRWPRYGFFGDFLDEFSYLWYIASSLSKTELEKAMRSPFRSKNLQEIVNE